MAGLSDGSPTAAMSPASVGSPQQWVIDNPSEIVKRKARDSCRGWRGKGASLTVGTVTVVDG
jgi:hypothetical protein